VQPERERDVFSQTHKLIEFIVHHTLDRPLKSERVLRSMIRMASCQTFIIVRGYAKGKKETNDEDECRSSNPLM
jgi:hypothetical protein